MVHIAYDAEVDALLIVLRDEVQADYGEEVAPGVTVDLDAEGNIVALEVLDASERLGRANVETVQVDLSPTEPRAASRRGPRADLSGYAEGQPGTWLSIPEFAKRAGVSHQAVRQAVKEGRLRGLPLRPGSSHLMVAEAELAAWQPNPVRQAAGKARAAQQ
ncbi:MAG: DUF2283 domain-containing protein [Chloroflexi bacterium]|nr:DUF2283 domain-containing protein [Chloroflexota bacterium]